MKLKLRILGAALLAASAAPAWALQLGQIQVKSALNQPLVAAIPLHPENLTELEGLTVELAPAADYARAGLQITPTDLTLRFSIVTDNNGQKLLLVTSSEPITDPYLDFLLQVNTRQGKQVREFVALLNPVIAAPAPEVQIAPVASAPAPQTQAPAELPPASAFPQSVPAPAPKPAESKPPQPKPTAPAPATAQPAAQSSGGAITVEKGDTLYVIARHEVGGSRGSINQMMLALKAANPDAFFKDNINNLRSGAILRIPTRDEIDRTSLAEANAEVHRQYEAWRAARPQSATVLAGTAAAAAANAAPEPEKSAPQSDHLALTPPSGEGSGASSRAGVAGGTGNETVTGLQQQLQNDRGTLVSLEQSNADLESRVRSLKDLADKSDKLLSLKDATVAELQRKLAEVQSGKSGVAGASAGMAAAASASKQAAVPAASTQSGSKPATAPRAGGEPWFNRPVTWFVAGLVVLALIVLGLLRRRRGDAAAAIARGPLPDPDDVTPPQSDSPDEEAALRAEIAEHPESLAAHLALCRLIHARGDEPALIEAAKAMRAHVDDLHCPEWREVAEMGEELAPHLPLFELPPAVHDYPESVAAASPYFDESGTDEPATAVVESEPAHAEDLPAQEPFANTEAAPEVSPEPAAEPEFADDPVDTKLDLARAYLDMGDPVGARAMLDEVLEEGSQTQKDEARRLLADVAG